MTYVVVGTSIHVGDCAQLLTSAIVYDLEPYIFNGCFAWTKTSAKGAMVLVSNFMMEKPC